MTIDRIGHLEPIQPNKKTGRNEYVRENDRTDTINLSEEAIEKAEIYQVVELIRSAPELDDSQIAAIRERINDPAYLNEAVISATADKLLNVLSI
jgi:negative regulator of flagellin synthesis FlgM